MWLFGDRAKHLKTHHDVVRERDTLRGERDALRGERDQLRIELAAAQRSDGLSAHGMKRADTTAPFPVAALPMGALPPITVIDVGAQRLDNEEHAYQPLVVAGIARTIGFEPLADAAQARADAEPNVVMLDHFIGDGTRRTFHINKFDATSSLFPSNLPFLDRFDSLSTMCATVKTLDVATTRLDDIPEVPGCDFLKLDVQGGELDVLKGAARLLAETVSIHCEVEFAEVYKGQPLFGDVDAHLRAAGFELIDITNVGYSTVKGLPRPIARSQLLWGEAVYMRTPGSLATLSAEKIVKAAVIAHVNYGLYDVAASFLAVLDRVDGGRHADLYGADVVKAMEARSPAPAARAP